MTEATETARQIVAELENKLAAAEVPSRRWLELGWRSLRVVQPK